jgi:hypothetical protein
MNYDLVGGSGSVGGALLDNEHCNVVTWGVPGASPYSGFANNFGKGTLRPGIDFTCTIKGYKNSWPNGTLIEWSFPSSGGASGFAFAYPLIFFGGSNGNVNSVYGVKGPWPMKINALTTLNVTYDLTLGYNPGSYDTLIDTFVTASPTSVDGSFVAEISFFAQANGMNFCPGSSVHQFSFGPARVGIQGKQIWIEPCNAAGTARVAILSGTIDLKEIYQYVASIGLGGLTGNEYVRGTQFGVEVQRAAPYNVGPYQGSLRFDRLSYNWT